jgi:hypothetical protein
MTWTWVLISLLAAIVVVVVGLLVGGTARRNRRLRAWAKSVAISPAQAEAMHALWTCRAGKPPSSDPLDALTEQEVAYVVNICGASFRSREFGDASVVRVASFRSFKSRGFSDRQAAVLTGMTVNMVGRRDA